MSRSTRRGSLRSAAPRDRYWLALLAALCLCLGGCTVAHMQHEAAAALEWLRLKDGTRMTTSARWQLSRSARIRVEQVAPAADPAWLRAAQSGVDAVFPGSAHRAGPADFRLLVSWPRDTRVKPGPEVSLWEVIDMDQFLPDFQSPMALRVALLREADGALVEAAELRVTPHWFASQARAPALINGAFRDFAGQFSSAY